MSRLARAALVALVLLNVTYFAWTRGGLALFGTQPAAFSEREPQRIAQQVRPGAIRIGADAAAATAAAAAAPVVPAAPAAPVDDPESR